MEALNCIFTNLPTGFIEARYLGQQHTHPHQHPHTHPLTGNNPTETDGVDVMDAIDDETDAEFDVIIPTGSNTPKWIVFS